MPPMATDEGITGEQATARALTSPTGKDLVGPGPQPGWKDATEQILGLGGPDHVVIAPSLAGDKEYAVRQVKPDDFDGLCEMMKGMGFEALSKKELQYYYNRIVHPLEFVVWYENTEEAVQKKKFMGLMIQRIRERTHPEVFEEGEEITPRMCMVAHYIKSPEYTPKRDNVIKVIQRLPFHQLWSCKVNVGINYFTILITNRFIKDREERPSPWFLRIAETLQQFSGKPPFLFDRIKRSQLLTDIDVQAISEDNVDEVLEYDKTIFNIYDREDDVREYFALDDPDKTSNCVVAYEGGKVAGYAVLRKHAECYTIEPLYADYLEIATTLFADLLKKVEGDTPVYLLLHKKNKEFTDFLSLQMKWKPVDLLRQYTVQAIQLDWDKAFTIYRDFQI